jgi:hypothetical protein
VTSPLWLRGTDMGRGTRQGEGTRARRGCPHVHFIEHMACNEVGKVGACSGPVLG